MKEATKLSKAFEQLAKKYPAAAKELAKDFTAAIGVAAANAKIAAERGDQIHRITVEGKVPDGRIYRAEFDVVFPKGTKIMIVKEREHGQT